MRAAALLCAVLLVSCQRGKNDPRLFEVKSPAHITVRNIDAPKPVDCSTSTTWKEEFSCRTSPAPRIGCAYVEVGADADAPIVRGTAPSTPECMSLSGTRQMLQRLPGQHVELEFDPDGTRAALRVDAVEWALFLHKGQLMHAQLVDPRGRIPGMKRGPDGRVIWNTLPPLLAMVPLHEARFTDEDVQQLLATTPDAQRVFDEAFVHALQSSFIAPDRGGWQRLYEHLDAAGRQQVRDTLLLKLQLGEASLLPWLEADTEVPREVLVDTLSAALRDDGAATLLFDALFRLAPQKASRFACDEIEASVLTGDSLLGTETLGTVLALIAKYKVKCPWVAALLEEAPCDPSLRRESLEDEDDTLGNLPLATAADRARALELKFASVDSLSDEDEDFVSDDHAGWLLLAAVDVQGPLPEAFVKRNARRTYRRVEKFSGPFHENPCIQTTTPPAEWACRMPLWLTAAEHEGCRLDIDDAARTLTVTGVPGAFRKQLPTAE